MTDTPFKQALANAVDRMMVESLGAVKREEIWLHLRRKAAKKLMASPEMEAYMKSDQFVQPGMDLQDFRDGIYVPTRIYGIKAFVSEYSSCTSETTLGGLVRIMRITPSAYLYWQPGEASDTYIPTIEAWFMPLEYVF